jgi:acyl-CoA synthetase (AMP-forming)/AMP-acid ligase II
VSSIEIEDILLTHLAVNEAAVIGVPDDKWGERPIAIVVLAPDAEAPGLEKQLKEHVARHAERGLISRYAVPDRIVPVEELPRTSVGKLDKKALRQAYIPA